MCDRQGPTQLKVKVAELQTYLKLPGFSKTLESLRLPDSRWSQLVRAAVFLAGKLEYLVIHCHYLASCS